MSLYLLAIVVDLHLAFMHSVSSLSNTLDLDIPVWYPDVINSIRKRLLLSDNTPKQIVKMSNNYTLYLTSQMY